MPGVTVETVNLPGGGTRDVLIYHDDNGPAQLLGGADVQVAGSDVVVGGKTLTLDGTQLSGPYADMPTVAQAQAAVGVTYPTYFATDTGTAYSVSGSSWVAV
ncbi:MAG TPA: hypothetical protein VKA50_03080 [Gammaproteobacteria bacterium]|nr:hypothetical protein [Gammaproteobacteria bacterium]